MNKVALLSLRRAWPGPVLGLWPELWGKRVFVAEALFNNLTKWRPTTPYRCDQSKHRGKADETIHRGSKTIQIGT